MARGQVQMRVHAVHGKFEEFISVWLKTWSRVKTYGVYPNSRSYLIAIEWCAHRNRLEARKPEGRQFVLRVANALMKNYLNYERTMYKKETGKYLMSNTEARRVERIWAYYIKVLSM